MKNVVGSETESNGRRPVGYLNRAVQEKLSEKRENRYTVYISKVYFQVYINYTWTKKDWKDKHHNVDSDYGPGREIKMIFIFICVLLYIFQMFYNAYCLAFVFRKINKEHYFWK